MSHFRTYAGRSLFCMVLCVTWFQCLCASSADAANSVWLEAEQFDHPGGWKNDPQFIDHMGSPYLLAVGLGEPVEDAVTTAAVPEGGRYRLWVRTKDWVPEHHPGRFDVLVGGKPAGHEFGASGRSGWGWEDGGVCELAGPVEVRLHDLTGYYGRCDVVVLCDDLEWTPPSDKDEIAALRETHGGVSREIEDQGPYDVVVVGGGLAGCTAAVAASRNGAKVALVQNRPVLGGNASTEILVPPVGVWPGEYRRKYPLDPRETGFVEEYRTAGFQKVSEGKLYSKRLLRFVSQEPDLDLNLNAHATGVEMAPGVERRIAAVLAVDVHTGRRMRFPGRIFLDCTGDAVVGVAAGAEFRHGKESKAMYHEPWAPDEPNRNTMGNGLKYFPQNTGEPQTFETPPWAMHFPSCDDFTRGRHPLLPRSSEIDYQWILELGGLRDTYADAEEIRDDLLRLIYGIWDHTKNHCPRLREAAEPYKLVWVGYVAGKRENRRLLGDYVLTQNDIGRDEPFEDAVAFGGWICDDHHSAGFFYDGSFGQHQDRAQHTYKAVPFAIPFRSLYSRNVENLMMAGRDISATHLALSDTRVMLTCATIGHAAGTGAALAAQENTTPRGVYRDHLTELQQQLLKEGARVMGVKADDPRDLAPKARATASSEQTRETGEVMAAGNVTNGYARAAGEGLEAVTNAWAADPDAAGPHWVELAWDGPVALNAVHVTFQTPERAPKGFAVQAWQDGRWVEIAGVDDNRHRRHVLGLDPITTDKLRVVLDEPAAVCEIRVYDEPPRVVEAARRAHRTMRLPDQGPFLPWPIGEDPHQYPGIVVDTNEAEIHGVWVPSTWSEPFIQDGYLHDGDTDKGRCRIVFHPDVPKAGRYEVRIAYLAFDNRATNTPVTIHTAKGETTVHVNQREKAPIDGLFRPLGTYDFPAGKATIEISNTDTDGYVVIDAVQLVAAP